MSVVGFRTREIRSLQRIESTDEMPGGERCWWRLEVLMGIAAGKIDTAIVGWREVVGKIMVEIALVVRVLAG